MATNPSGQSCGNCSFWINQSCRATLPSLVDPFHAWRPVDADDWCRTWNVWPGSSAPAASAAALSFGTSPPSSGAGNDGDFYVKYDLVSGPIGGGSAADNIIVYQKQSGYWVSYATIGP